MANIYFKCSCGKVLAVDETAVGRTVQCPDCGQSVVIPSPAIQWNCQTCDHEMAAPGELEGQKVQCAECQDYVTVPVIMSALKHRDLPKCPGCGADIKLDDVLCINCGLNLKTGEKIKSAFEDHNSQRHFSIRMTVIPAIAIVVLCTLAFAWWRLGIATNRSGKPLAEPSRAEQPAVVPDDQTISKGPQPTPVPPVTPEPVSVKTPEPGPTSPAVRIQQTTITDKGKRPLQEKLNDIVIPQLDFRQANIVDVIKYLDHVSIVYDKESAPGERGVHFILKLKHPGIAAQADLPLLTLSLRNIVLMDAIKYITEVTGLKYRIEEDAVVITPNPDIIEQVNRDQQASRNVRTNLGAPRSLLVPASLTSIMNNIAVIRTKDSSGTGFVLNINGKKFLVTNRHVIADAEAQEISFEFISGKKPTIKSFEIAKDMDLVRFEIDSSFICNGLSLSPTPNMQIGDDIIVYGNSGGVGAITELPGKITGLGPSVIEITAEFVRGNSGSPIIDANSNVVAVATLVTRGNPKDWVTKGTRFEGVRRFGVRLDNVEWQRINLDRFVKQGKILNEAYTYLEDLFDLYIFMCVNGKDKYARAAYYCYSRAEGAARTRTRWSGELITMVRYYQQIFQGGISGEQGFILAKQKLMRAPLAPKQILKNTRWIDGWYSDQAKMSMKDLDWMYAHFKAIKEVKFQRR